MDADFNSSSLPQERSFSRQCPLLSLFLLLYVWRLSEEWGLSVSVQQKSLRYCFQLLFYTEIMRSGEYPDYFFLGECNPSCHILLLIQTLKKNYRIAFPSFVQGPEGYYDWWHWKLLSILSGQVELHFSHLRPTTRLLRVASRAFILCPSLNLDWNE